MRVYECHAVRAARINDICFTQRATGLGYVRNAMFARLFDIVSEGNEPVADKRHPAHPLDPVASPVVTERIVWRMEYFAKPPVWQAYSVRGFPVRA